MTYALDAFPNLRKAYLEMSHNNGGINVGRTEADALKASEPVMKRNSIGEDTMATIEAWVGTLSEDEMLTLVDGEGDDMRALINRDLSAADATHLNFLLEELFDVC